MQHRDGAVDRVGMQQWFHLIAHARGGFRGVTEPASGRWLWDRLRPAFPVSLAWSLMPEHLHGVVRGGSGEQEAQRLRRVLGQHGSLFGHRGWDVEEPDPIRSVDALARMARYVEVNAVRGGLVDDPLCWPFCTLRDVVGAVVDPWVSAHDVARWTRRPRTGAAQRWLRFVAAVCEAEVPFPVSLRAEEFAMIATQTLVDATVSALRVEPGAVGRRGPARQLLVQLSTTAGVRQSDAVARACGTTRRSIERLRLRPPPSGLEAAMRCLSDPRLRVTPEALASLGNVAKSDVRR